MVSHGCADADKLNLLLLKNIYVYFPLYFFLGPSLNGSYRPPGGGGVGGVRQDLVIPSPAVQPELQEWRSC